MRNHGPFTIGKDARDAVKAAVMVEDVARSVHIAPQLGEPVPIPQDIDSLFDRYQNVYGQTARPRLEQNRDEDCHDQPTPPRSAVRFLTGSQHLYGRRRSRRSPTSPARSRRAAPRPACPSRWSGSRC